MKRAIWAVVIALPLVAVLAYGFGRDPTAIPSPLLNKAAPGFSLQTVDGRPLSLQALRGRPIVLNFSASWCQACKYEQQDLVQAWLTYRPRGVEFVGVTFKDSPSAARDFMRSYGGNWPIVKDPELQTALNYGVTGVPETFFIDRYGVVRYKSAGPVTAELLRSQIARISRRVA